MALETVTHISDLVVTNPTATDPASQGDDHIRNIKKAIKNSFPSITGAVTLTQAQINSIPSQFAGVDADIAALDQSKANKSVTLTGGDGISTTIGDLSANRTINVDSTVVRTSGNQTVAGIKDFTGELKGHNLRNTSGYFHVDSYNTATYGTGSLRTYYNATEKAWVITGVDGSGATVGANIHNASAPTDPNHLTNKAYVDAKVKATDDVAVKTSGNQTISGTKTFATNPVVETNIRLSMPHATGPTKEVHYTGTTVGFYDRTNLRWDLSVDANGNLTPRGTMDASNISGTLDDARIPSSIVRTSRTLTGGDGINTIGDLTANRTISVDSTVVRTTRNLVAGNGLTGGGTLGADRTFTLGTPSSITGTSGNSVTSTSHTHSLDLGNLPQRTGTTLDADTTPMLIYINGTTDSSLGRIGPNDLKSKFGIVTEGRYITAGNGLTGGGDFTTNRTIALGTPSSITSSSTNSVTSTSHTHALGEATVRSLIADGPVGAVGTYAFLTPGGTGRITPGTTRAGSTLYYTGGSGSFGDEGNNHQPAGTWRCMGYLTSYWSGDGRMATLWLRIS